MVKAVIAILAGMLLLSEVFKESGTASRLVDRLRPFDAVIGVSAIIIGIVYLFSLAGVFLILGGLVLGARALSSVPNVGDDLVRASDKVAGFRVLIGSILIVLGILHLLGRIL